MPFSGTSWSHHVLFAETHFHLCQPEEAGVEQPSCVDRDRPRRPLPLRRVKGQSVPHCGPSGCRAGVRSEGRQQHCWQTSSFTPPPAFAPAIAILAACLSPPHHPQAWPLAGPLHLSVMPQSLQIAESTLAAILFDWRPPSPFPHKAHHCFAQRVAACFARCGFSNFSVYRGDACSCMRML